MPDQIKVLNDTEYCLMKERLLATLREALDAFVVLEQSINPQAEKADFIYAQMEVCTDIAASAALDAGRFTRGEFIDLAVISFETMSVLKAEDDDSPIKCVLTDIGLSETVHKPSLN
jgi:hypothetical protein